MMRKNYNNNNNNNIGALGASARIAESLQGLVGCTLGPHGCDVVVGDVFSGILM